MTNVSNDQIFAALMDIKQDIGSLSATMSAHKDSFVAHVVDDQKMAADIDHIQLRLASQRGSIRAWGIVGTICASVAGIAASFWRHTS